MNIALKRPSQLYHIGDTNYCPGCHRTHWYIGRYSAECAFCATALPLAPGTIVFEVVS